MTADSSSGAINTALIAIAGGNAKRDLRSAARAGLTAIIAVLAVTIASPARATNFTVDTTSDTSGASDCSLRDAINAANGSPTPGSTLLLWEPAQTRSFFKAD